MSLSLGVVCNELALVKHKWFDFGLLLNIPRSRLLLFEKEDDPFSAVVDHWLKGNIKEEGCPPSWKSVVKILESDYVEEFGLAKHVKRKFCPDLEEQGTSSGSSRTAGQLAEIRENRGKSGTVGEVEQATSSSSLHPDVEADLRFKLNENIKLIRKQYASYVRRIRLSLQSKGTTVKDLRAFVLSLDAFQPSSDTNVKLFSDKEEKLEKAADIEDIFCLLTKECASFFNYEIFQSIIEEYDIDTSQEKLKYPIHLQKYIDKHKLSEFYSINPKLEEVTDDSKELILKLDMELTRTTGTLKDRIEAIARVLKLKPSSLRLIKLEEGCVIVTLILPVSVAKIVFTNKDCLGSKQKSSLQALSVRWLKCDSCFIKLYQEALDSTNCNSDALLKNTSEGGREEEEGEKNLDRRSLHVFRLESQLGTISTSGTSSRESSYTAHAKIAQKHPFTSAFSVELTGSHGPHRTLATPFEGRGSNEEPTHQQMLISIREEMGMAPVVMHEGVGSIMGVDEGGGGAPQTTPTSTGTTPDGGGGVVGAGFGDKYTCPTCNKVFNRPYRLQRHLQIHNPNRPKTLMTMSDLDSGISSPCSSQLWTPVMAGAYPYDPLCDSVYTQASTMLHTGNEPCSSSNSGLMESKNADFGFHTQQKEFRMPQRKGGIQLWQFLYSLLTNHEKKYKDIIEGTANMQEKEFRILEPECIAAWWGHHKNKPTMTFDKFSRSLRYYYDKGILMKIPGEKFVYRFMIDPELMYRHIGSSDCRPKVKPMPQAAKAAMAKFPERLSTNSKNQDVTVPLEHLETGITSSMTLPQAAAKFPKRQSTDFKNEDITQEEVSLEHLDELTPPVA